MAFTSNQSPGSLQEFFDFCNNYGVSIDATTQQNFTNYLSSVNGYEVGIGYSLEVWKHLYFQNFLKQSQYYYYVSNQFVDYGPLPNFAPIPTTVKVVNGVPINPGIENTGIYNLPSPLPSYTSGVAVSNVAITRDTTGITLQISNKTYKFDTQGNLLS